MDPDVVVNLGTAIATIGVMVALFMRVDKRIDALEARIDRLDARFEGRVDALARDVIDVKVSVARIEGHLESRHGFRPAGRDRPAEPGLEEASTEYRQTG